VTDPSKFSFPNFWPVALHKSLLKIIFGQVTIAVKNVVVKINALLHLVNFRYGRKSGVTVQNVEDMKVLLSVNSEQQLKVNGP
jgi:hypothetical protein